ncbi:hypothetical protein BpHYR1_011856 [Brachionus plicatilis]|uniref:Uncharacterized protein n=1 Tax=Brachionus plicatilis TaxID=10195 RepID=A0A3M7RK97_BRAPC|nr:hypothetical protein BpHYR1_011856 [Brachionus plicatilis]
MDTPLEQLHHLALDKLKTHRIDNRLFDLSENYIRCGLKNSVPLVTRLEPGSKCRRLEVRVLVITGSNRIYLINK